MAYEYDDLGRKTETIAYEPGEMNSAQVTEYGYDELSRLATVTVVKRHRVAVTPEVTSYKFALSGELDEQHQANGVVMDLVYDQLGRLDTSRHYGPDAFGGDPNTLADNPLLAEFDYTLRADGKRTSETVTGPSGPNGSYTWQYDDAARLTSESFDHMGDGSSGAAPALKK